MKILAVIGSPRPKGNSTALLNAFLDGARSAGAEVEIIKPHRMKIAPCTGCERCRENDGRCVVKDEFQLAYDMVLNSDAIVLATPIYFGSVSAQLKTFIDRLQCFWALHYILKKPMPPGPAGSPTRKGVLLAVSGQNKDEMFVGARIIFKHVMSSLQAERWAELCAPGFDFPGDILKSPETLQKAYELGRRLALGLSAENV